MGKLDLSKFKKVRSGEKHTVLRHPEGHEITIFHSKLSKPIKDQLDKLPSHEMPSKENLKGNPKLQQAYSHMSKGGSSEHLNVPSKDRTKGFNQAAKRVDSNVKNQVHMANGGYVADKKENYEDASNPQGIQADTSYRYEGYKEPKSQQSVGNADIDSDLKKGLKKAFRFAEGGTPAPIDKDKAQQAQDSMRKAFHFQDGGAPVMAEGEGPNGPMDPIEAQYGLENFNAKEAVDNSIPGQIAKLEQEAPIIPPNQDNSHAHLSEAIKNLSQKFIPQAPESSALTQEAVGIGNQPEIPTQQATQSPQQIKDPGAPHGSLIDQAKSDVALANKAELANAGNAQQSAKQEADIYGKQNQQMQDLHAKYEELGSNLHHKFENLSAEVEKGIIDPHRWWDSKSTGSKVLTAIGMMFAGAGIGAGGHPELAGKAIDEAVNRDIDAQKHNLNNKNTLLGKYMDMYNSLPQAEAAARLTMNAGIEGLLKQNAAKLGSASAVNTALQSIAARRQALLPQMEALAKGQVMGQMYEGMSGPQQVSNDAEQAYQQRMEHMRVLNPDLGKDMENKYLPGVGASRVPVPDKLREEISTRKDLSDKLAQLEIFAKKHQGTTMDRSIVNQGKAMAAQVQDAYRTAHQQGVFKESEKNFLESILHADPTAFLADIRTIPGYRQARKFNDETVKQYYKSYGIKPFEGHSGIQEASQSTQPQIAVNKKTGERIIQQNGKWVPYNGQ